MALDRFSNWNRLAWQDSPPEEKMTFGNSLKALRMNLGITQAEAAQRLSCGDPDGSPSKRTLEEWEAGRTTPMLVLQEGVLARLRAYQCVERFRDMPLYGEVPAGALSDSPQLVEEVISVPIGKYPSDAFALRVRGDSMIGKNIFDDDIVIVHKREAVHGDVVVALIDGETTLKTLVYRNGKCTLRSENPKFKSPAFTDHSVIQAVMIDTIPTAETRQELVRSRSSKHPRP
jgi:SOS-response transcriptional repressor LexA